MHRQRNCATVQHHDHDPMWPQGSDPRAGVHECGNYGAVCVVMMFSCFADTRQYLAREESLCRVINHLIILSLDSSRLLAVVLVIDHEIDLVDIARVCALVVSTVRVCFSELRPQFAGFRG